MKSTSIANNRINNLDILTTVINVIYIMYIASCIKISVRKARH